MVLSGNAEEYEDQMQDFCPSLKVIYNKKQSHAVPLTKIFLEDFDNWIQSAQKEGKKIAFRCNCGCHRTGRLAAYYQMKYQNIPMADALAIMNKHGKYMLFFPSLKPQVKALNDYINGSPCSTKERYCVTN
jgi:protein-tyrosine phosphatase